MGVPIQGAMETWKKLWTAFHKLQEKDRQDGVEEVIKQLVRESLQEKNRLEINFNIRILYKMQIGPFIQERCVCY